MCGRFYLEKEEDEAAQWLQEADGRLDRLGIAERTASGEVFPGQLVAAAALGRDLKPAVFPMRWGFGEGKLLINARSETADRLPAFRDAFRHRRCLILMTRYYEWMKTDEGAFRYAFWPESACALAGLYRFEPGERLPRVTVLTREAIGQARLIHPRMPVLLPLKDRSRWLDRAGDPTDALRGAVTGVRFREEPGDKTRK